MTFLTTPCESEEKREKERKNGWRRETVWRQSEEEKKRCAGAKDGLRKER